MKSVLVNGGLRVHTVPKAASTSMSAAMLWKRPRRASPQEESDDWRFMAVRHPLERLVSAWRYFTPASRMRHSQVFRHNVQPDIEFEPFAEIVIRNPTRDRHTTPQAMYHGGADVQQLVRFENLQVEWAKLVGRFPVRHLDHKNATDHGHWKAYFPPDLMRAALDVYAADMELYENAA